MQAILAGARILVSSAQIVIKYVPQTANGADMNAFQQCSNFEKSTVAKITTCMKPNLDSGGLGMEFITDWQGQHVDGDLWLCDLTGTRSKARMSVDVKSERKASPNMFFETYSNFQFGPRCKLGWGLTITSDWIWYHFDQAGTLAWIDLPKLRAWLFATDPRTGRARIEGFREKPQMEYTQKNNTVGRLIPFAAMPADALPCGHLFDNDTARGCSREELLAHIEQACRARMEQAATPQLCA